MGKNNKGKSKSKASKNTNDPQELKVNFHFLSMTLSKREFIGFIKSISFHDFTNILESRKQNVRVATIPGSIRLLHESN